MRSFIAYCCGAGISEWIATPDVQDSCLLKLLKVSPDMIHREIPGTRNAAFFTLGRINGNGLPCAVVSKGDEQTMQALLPAVIEAKSQARPLLVITLGESLKSPTPFGDYAATLFINPESPIDDTIFSNWDYLQPLHIHIALDHNDSCEDLGDRTEDFSPSAPPEVNFPRPNLTELARMLRFDSWKGVVLMLGGLEPEEQDPALWLAEELGAPLVADATSGLREELADLCLRDADRILRSNPPATILHIGSIPTSAFWQELENMEQVNVFSISRSGLTGLNRKTHTIRGSMETIAKALGEINPVGDPERLMRLSRKNQGKIEELLMSHTESAQALLFAISNFACIADTVYVASPLPLKAWNHFSQYAVPVANTVSNLEDNHQTGSIPFFFGRSVGNEEAWCIMDKITDSGQLEGLDLYRLFPSQKRVIVSIDMEPSRDDAKAIDLNEYANTHGIRYIVINSSFDLELLDALDASLTIIEIRPDLKQTQAFYRAMDSLS